MSVSLRWLSPDEDRRAAALLVQLRDHPEAELARRIALQRDAHGYQLVGAFDGDALVGLASLRAVHTLARGPHLHVDDVVVDRARRGGGIGAALLAFLEDEARRRGAAAIFLDSRPDVIEFYRGRGYEAHTATLMRRRIPS